MTLAQTPFLSSSADTNARQLCLAVFLAVLIHGIILCIIEYKKPTEPLSPRKTIEVTVLQKSATNVQKEANSLAEAHQNSGGEIHNKAIVKEKVPSGQSETKQLTANKAITEPKKMAQNKLINSVHAPNTVLAETDPTKKTEPVATPPKLLMTDLQQQITQLGERIRDSQPVTENSKIKFVNQVSAHKFLAAQYVRDWEDKIERTGNLNYPAAARNIGESETLTMDVGINADGSIYSMRIVKSSGNPILDEAAKRIVKMSAPYAALPADLLREINVLVITRVWKFSDETGMTAR
jgi:protein TonB